MAASRHRGKQEVKEKKEVGRMNKYNEVANDARAKLKKPRGVFFRGGGWQSYLCLEIQQTLHKGLRKDWFWRKMSGSIEGNKDTYTGYQDVYIDHSSLMWG